MSRQRRSRPGAHAPPLSPGELLLRGTEDHYLDAALYDFEYVEQQDDIRWYAEELARRCLPGARVLELGAGTGRITLPLARAQLRVVALDRAETMLAALEVKLERERELAPRVRLLCGDMRAIACADASFEAVIAPFNCLMHLYTWRDLLACFREIERVLVPGGVCLFDVLVPDFEWLRWDPKQRHSATKFVHPRTGQTMCYSTNHDYDPHTQVCHVRIYYDLGPRPRPHNPPHRLVHLAHRQIFPEELRALTHAAGLEWVSLHADFGADPLTGPQNESQCVICRKPEAPAQT